MFIPYCKGTKEIYDNLAKTGCKAGETLSYQNKYNQSGLPGISGNTFPVKETLKAAGAKWDGKNKAWVFQSYDALDEAVKTIIGE